MTPPISLASFYDTLLAHDWQYDRSDDHGIWKKGLGELSRLSEQAKISPEHQALFSAMHSYQFDTTKTAALPPRPADNAPFTQPPPRPDAAALANLSEEDRATVLASSNPAVALRQVVRRLDIETRVPLLAVLNAFGATVNAQNPARWTFPDGAVAMVKFDRQAWVEHQTLKTGQGAVALASRLVGCPVEQALDLVENLAVAPSSPVTSVAPSEQEGDHRRSFLRRRH